MGNKESIVFYKGWLDAVRGLPAEQFKEAVLAILEYGIEGIEFEGEGIGQVTFNMAKGQIDKNNQRYENGTKGGRPKNQTKPNHNQTETKQNQTITKPKPKAENQKPNDNVNVNDNENVNILTVSNETVRQTETVRRVVDAWNELEQCGVKPISKLTSESKRYKSLVARVKEYSEDDVIKAIDMIRQSDFLIGKNKRGWVITFDWFVLPNNFPKVLEGNYGIRGEPSKNVTQIDEFLDIARNGL